MATPPVSTQRTGCVPGTKQDLGIVPQAMAYHRMLAKLGPDGGYDEFNDADNSFSDSDSEDMARHPNNSQSTKDESPESDSHDGEIPVFAVKFNDRLLASPGPRTPSEECLCVNSCTRPGLWVTEPNLGLSDYDMGFLSQLAQLCIHANIKRCSSDRCQIQRVAMEKIAPQCNWSAFREWALVTMSCQASMNTQEKESPAHTHITTVVTGMCKILKDCRQSSLDSTSTFRSMLDGDSASSVDLAQVSNIIYWMIKIQSQIGIGPTNLGRWNHHFLPDEVTLPWIERAVYDAEDLGLCKNRLWNLVGVSDRKQSDLPDIISVLKSGGGALGQEEHEFCTPSKCQWAHMNSTSVTQLHKCIQNEKIDANCPQKEFPVDLLETALEIGSSTAWLCEGARLSDFQDPYIAISHVWSDGTGVGVKEAGTVNSCLFDFFAGIATQLKCKAVWWDALSIPSEPKARSKALNMMHRNYSNARYTVVHDNALLNFPWSGDGSPCLALVLSTWFTRGWTALELSMSKTVKVMFKNPLGGAPVIKDLDKDVLAQNPGSTSRAHWLATTLVKRLRRPVDDVGDLLAILSSRSTSWVRDRTTIAALLAGVPDCDFNQGESLITIKILHYLGKIPYFCLFHTKPTIRNTGPFSWCPATLDDMPVDTSADLGGNRSGDLLEIDENGAVVGYWYCHALDSSSAKGLKAYGNDLAATVKVNVALEHWDRCLLLHPYADRHNPSSLLVIPIKTSKENGILDCRYIGTVVGDQDGEESKRERPLMLLKVRLGAKEPPYAKGIHAERAINTMVGKNIEEQSQSADSPPETPAWLQLPFIKPLGIDRSLKPLQAELVIKKDHNELLEAIRTRRKNAALYLVKYGVSLNAMGAIEIFQQLGSSEEACASMKLLGDVYAEAGQLREAISVYRFVEHEYVKIKDTIKNPLRPLLSNYALATTFVRAAREVSDRELQTRFQASAASYLDQAKEYLNQIIEDCDRRAEARGEADLLAEERRRKDAEQRRHMMQDSSGFDYMKGVPPTRILSRAQSTDFKSFGLNSTSQSPTVSQPEEHPTVATAEQVRNALRWHRLELNVIADLTVLLAGKEDFDAAARTFQKAFRIFGSLPDQDVEGFNLQSPERGQLGYKEKNPRDEQAADVYERALKRFEVTFHGDHTLIFLTSLHLGVNYLLRSKFSSAETNLIRALNGLVSRLSPLSSDNEHSALSHEDCDNEHIVIGLTRYHLGVLFRHQNKLEEARKQLQQAKNIALRFDGYEGRLLRLSATHELGMIMSQKLKTEQHTHDLVIGADECFNKVRLCAEKWLKGEGNPPPPPRRFLLAMRRLYFLSFSNSVLLHLYYDKLEYGTIEKLQRNLDEDGEAKDDAAKIKKEDQRARDVAECEARRILGQAYVRRRDFHSAEHELSVALKGYIYLCGERHLQTLEVSVIYADTLAQLHTEEQARREDPERLLEKTVERYDQTVGSYHPETLLACLKLGEVYTRHQKLAEAEKFCERAHHGFERAYGSDHLLTARASRLLGSVYAEKGMLGKSREMFGKAYEAFSTMSNADPATVTDMETLQAAMDYANMSALVRTTVTRNKAMNLYKLAIEGFSTWGNNPLAVTSGMIARMRLGALYGDICNFREGRSFIERAISGFQASMAENNDKVTQDSLEESFLEARLKLAQLKLNELKREKNHGSHIKVIRLILQDIHSKLIKLRGNIHKLTLEAYTALGELFLEGHGGSKPEHSVAEGEKILLEVLSYYGVDGKARLALGHPKKVRIIDSLVSYYDRIEKKEKVQELNSQLWDELVEAYGFDQAVFIIDATSGPKHNARCIKFDYGRLKKWRKSGACAETSSFGARLTAIAKLFGHGKIHSTPTRVSKTKRLQPQQPYQQPSSPTAGPSTSTNSFNHDTANSDRARVKNEQMFQAPPKNEQMFQAPPTNEQMFQAPPKNEQMFQAPPKNSSSSLRDSVHDGNDSQRCGAAAERDSRNPPPFSDTSSFRTGSPSVAAFERDPRKSGGLPGASFSNANTSSLAECLADVKPVLKRTYVESAAYQGTSSPAAGSSPNVHDSHYDEPSKRKKFFGKLKEVKGKLKEAGREMKEAGKILRH